MAAPGALEHPKTLDLADGLGIMDCFALGILEAFLHHIDKYHSNGDITYLRPEHLAGSIRYTGNPEKLMAALIEAGFIDVLPDTEVSLDGEVLECKRCVVHGWSKDADYTTNERALWWGRHE